VADLPDALRTALAGRYELEALIGRGGMATVYRARDVKHGRRVAVKVLRPDLGELIGAERFVREIEIAARLMHPNILPLYDSGTAGRWADERLSGPAEPPTAQPLDRPTAEFLFYVMPYVDGESLRGLLNRVRLVDLAGAIEIVSRVAAALDYAHGEGILHRDIKPENILLPGGQAVVADFGIAKAVSSAAPAAGLTRTGVALGTPGYMSPEQAAGLLDLDRTTDVYSLAVVTYEMLVGGLPRAWVMPDSLAAGRFLDAGPDHRALLERLPPGTERALVRALALRPEERFPAPGEFASALAHPETATYPARDDARRALAAVERPDGPATAATAATTVSERATTALPGVPTPLLGAPTHLLVERVVDGEIPTEEFDTLLQEMRATFHVMGYETRTARSLIWTGRPPKKDVSPFDLSELMVAGAGSDNPDVLLRVTVRPGRTRIRLEQRLTEVAGGIYGGVWGGVGGAGVVGSIVGLGVATGAPLEVALMGAGLSAALGYALSRVIYRAVVKSKSRTLEGLADRLAEQCEDLVE
jgi:serine/threonine protein kinase